GCVRGRHAAIDHFVVDQFDPIACHILPSQPQQFARRNSIARQKSMQLARGRVAWLASVNQRHTATGPAQDQCSAKAGGSSADNESVKRRRTRCLRQVLLVGHHGTHESGCGQCRAKNLGVSDCFRPSAGCREVITWSPGCGRSSAFGRSNWSRANGEKLITWKPGWKRTIG